MTFAGMVALGALSATSASATTLTSCRTTDLLPGAQACVGFGSKNLLGGSADKVAAQKEALATLGFDWNGSTLVDLIEGLDGARTVGFATPLSGISYLGVHFGNGQGGPGNATAFYRLDAGPSLSTLTLAYNASSTVRVYGTGLAAAVPEPASWAMMIVGFGAVGYSLRRRPTVRVAYAA